MTEPFFPVFEGDTDWMDRAACKGQAPTDAFFPTRGEELKVAQSFCDRCPVAAECLEYALRNAIHHGIWGGKSERERRRLRRGRRWCAYCRKPFVPSASGRDQVCSPECRLLITPHSALRYRYGCRCTVCTQASSARIAGYRDQAAAS